MPFTYDEVRIFADEGHHDISVQLWYVAGQNTVYYPTKLAAEMAAIRLYPRESAERDPDSFVYYRTFHWER